MAILQLSRITNRKGIGTDLPQLAGAEFGWALDERKLFIGNGTIVDGAPVVGNTEILTEFSDILSFSTAYTYKGAEGGYVVSTGLDDIDVLRSLQDKFDDFVSVKDFGAVGDGIADDTKAINRALYELFCRGPLVGARRSLFFPAGNYRVTGAIKIPPHAKLWGEGLASSLIQFSSTTPESVTLLEEGVTYKIAVPGTTDFTTYGAVDSLAETIFVANATDPSLDAGAGTVLKWALNVVETSDSAHAVGITMGSGAAILPTGIEMQSMGIYSDEENTLLKLDSVTDSGFHYLGLHGPAVFDTSISAPNTSAVEIADTVQASNNITLSKLDTRNTTYCLKAEGRTRGVVLENSGINLHHKGVYVTNPVVQSGSLLIGTEYKIINVNNTDFTLVGADYNREGQTFTATGVGAGLGEVIPMDQSGPTGVVVSRNIFDNIAFEGIHFENTLFNSSGYNVFYNVGNSGAAVINLETDQCVSVGDLFEREDETAFPRIALNGNGGINIDGAHSIHLGSYERQVGIEAILPGGVTAGGIFTLHATASNSYRVDYNIARGGETRVGRLYVSNNTVAVNYDDSYTDTAILNVSLDVVVVGGPGSTDTELQFTTAAGSDAVFNYSIVRLD